MSQEIYNNDEIDLREIIQSLVKGWKVILTLTLLTGAIAFGVSKLQTPIYEASARVSIDQMALSLSTNPASTLTGDEMRQAVADALDLSAPSLPSAKILNDITDKTLFTITVQSPDAQFSAEVANAWAETGVAYIAEQVSSTANLGNGLEQFKKADQALLEYLEKNNLSGVTWGELAWLTGIGDISSPPADTTTLPALSTKQRLDLAALMQARVATENAYTELAFQAAEMESAASVNPPVVFKYAKIPAESISSNIIQNTFSGIIIGLTLGIFWVFTAKWWQYSDRSVTTEEEKAV